MKLAAVSVTRQGDNIAKKLKETFELEVYSSYNNKEFKLKTVSEKLMGTVDGIIFISSTGIAVRGIAPFLKGKDKDPAVVVVDCEGRFVISLAGGHLGGANELTLKVAEILEATPVITTATDSMGIDAPDMIAKDNNLIIHDMKIAKDVAAKLVDSAKVAFLDEDNKIKMPKGYVNVANDIKGIVTVSNKIHVDNVPRIEWLSHLRLIRKNIILGMGCRKDVDNIKVQKFVVDTLKKHNIDLRAVKTISTVEVKKDEKALIALSEFLGCAMEIHSLDEIKSVEHKYKGSDFVQKSIGVRAVCEPCVELGGGTLLTEKLSFEGITLCIGKLT
ncbi:MAG: cobalt-precorrin 5A hydrolase [Clostridium sp.]|uniref:cobalt-precorrin 5A hydrolase n=1 Tax=Clostridium sp. TaxID=1506 RepID=UPI0030468917